MRDIQLTQILGKQLLEIIVVADMRQEFPISGGHRLPIHAVHVQVIEAHLLLLIDMIEHIGPLSRQVHPHLRLIGDRFQLLAGQLHLLHRAATQYEERLPLFVERKFRPTRIGLMEQLRLMLPQIHLPEVMLALKGREIVERLAILGQDRTTQIG